MRDNSERSFASWKDRILFWTVTAFISGTVGLSTWIVSGLADRPTNDEVHAMIEKTAPYVADRKHIQAQLDQMNSIRLELNEVIRKNTEAINMLRIELAKQQAARTNN